MNQRQDVHVNPIPLKLLEQARKLRRSHLAGSALATYRRYLNLQPTQVGAWSDLGKLLLEFDLLDEAREAYDRALALDPQCLTARLALAGILIRKNDLNLAGATLAEAVQQDPRNFEAHQLLRLAFFRQGNWPELHSEFMRFLEVHPSDQAAWERSCLSLLFGHMPVGWEQYESRWHTPGVEHRLKEHALPQPLWNGEAFVGKTLLLRWEQGLGDVIMFVRYAALVKALGGRVMLEVIKPLVDLMATCPGIDEVIEDGAPIPPFDLQLPLLSLARVFKTDLDSIPADIPYLSVPKIVPHREGIDRILTTTEGLTRVGLVWAGNPRHIRDAERSISPALLKPLEALPGVVWHSFQTGPGGEPPFSRIIPMGPVIRGSFSDTAHALIGMDLVITVDTALAHLAGALGIPTFLLISTFPDWRWLMGRDDSPWYPTMRIFRQPEPGDWATVIKQVASDLSAGG